VTHRLLLLRHGEVTSHRGDVAVTDRGLEGAERLGRRLAGDLGPAVMDRIFIANPAAALELRP